MKRLRKITVLKIFMTVLCAVMLVLSCFYLTSLHRLVTIGCLITFATLTVVIPSLNAKHEIALKAITLFSLLCSLALVTFIVLDQTGLLYKFRDFETIKALILETREWGILTFFLITLLEVVILPIPSAVTIIIGIAIYDALITFFVTAAATILGSIISFSIGRTFGKKLIVWVCGKEKTEKYANLLTKGKFAFIFMMIFPFFPDDLICMLAGITNMTKRFFLLAMGITRTAAIAVYCFFGTGDIIPFRGWGIPVWIAIFVVILAFYITVEKVTARKRKQSYTKLPTQDCKDNNDTDSKQ